MSNDVTKYVGQQIKKFRKQKKMTQKDLGEKIGVKHNTISSYESGKNEPDQDMMFTLAHVLGVSINDLFPPRDDLVVYGKDYVNIIEVKANPKENSLRKPFVRLPVYGHISCGNGKIIYEEPIEYEEVPADWLNGGEYLMLRAEGDSMTGSRIFAGDKLLIRKQDAVENGEIAAVVIGEETLLKKVYRKDNLLILESSNDKYGTRVVDLNLVKNVKIIGKLKKSVTDF